MSLSGEIAIHTIFGEARGESMEGKIAVGRVILNRVKDGRWGHNAALVCLAPAQFSSWNNNDPNRKTLLGVAEDDAELIACSEAWNAVNTQLDPTFDGVLFYFTDSITPPSWAASMTQVAHIGHHLFYREA